MTDSHLQNGGLITVPGGRSRKLVNEVSIPSFAQKQPSFFLQNKGICQVHHILLRSTQETKTGPGIQYVLTKPFLKECIKTF